LRCNGSSTPAVVFLNQKSWLNGYAAAIPIEKISEFGHSAIPCGLRFLIGRCLVHLLRADRQRARPDAPLANAPRLAG